MLKGAAYRAVRSAEYALSALQGAPLHPEPLLVALAVAGRATKRLLAPYPERSDRPPPPPGSAQGRDVVTAPVSRGPHRPHDGAYGHPLALAIAERGTPNAP